MVALLIKFFLGWVTSLSTMDRAVLWDILCLNKVDTLLLRGTTPPGDVRVALPELTTKGVYSKRIMLGSNTTLRHILGDSVVSLTRLDIRGSAKLDEVMVDALKKLTALVSLDVRNDGPIVHWPSCYPADLWSSMT